MPYIVQDDRKLVKPTSPSKAVNPGELNFQVTMLINRFLRWKGLNYANINAAIGALECAKLELYRRIAAPYEDKKLAENGDVYTVEKS